MAVLVVAMVESVVAVCLVACTGVMAVKAVKVAMAVMVAMVATVAVAATRVATVACLHVSVLADAVAHHLAVVRRNVMVNTITVAKLAKLANQFPMHPTLQVHRVHPLRTVTSYSVVNSAFWCEPERALLARVSLSIKTLRPGCSNWEPGLFFAPIIFLIG